jgi:diguanylate cyclase (GGDEF)-like protein
MRDLADSLQAARGGAPRVLLLFDLDGFKDYNDTYGHPAGDALLARASGALSVAVASCGEAYRIGGDEFCVLGSVETTSQEALQAAAAAALSDHGEGFSISASCGAARLGGADDPASALRRADRELYRHKRTRSAASRQMVDVLLRALAERQPALVGPAPAVSGLAGAVAGRLGLAAQDAEEVMRAAKLRDVGKLGIPDGILGKAGPLTPEEQAFIREHTIIGERILTVAPALMGVGRIVRASHERWDGAGYPDGLAGDAIPLGARIIGACDAYVAMTSPRPHREAIPREAALAALRAGAGGQFDPVVVAALVAEIDRSAQPDLVAAAA